MFNYLKILIMKRTEKETKLNASDLSKEELKNICGGAWWEVRYENGKIVWIFHYFDDDKPADCIQLK